MKFKNILALVLISAGTTMATLWGYKHLGNDTYIYPTRSNDSGKLPVNYTGYTGQAGVNAAVDFIPAAAVAIPATVHIKTKTNAMASNNLPRKSPFEDMFDLDLGDLFGDRLRSLPQMASGSGVMLLMVLMTSLLHSATKDLLKPNWSQTIQAVTLL